MEHNAIITNDLNKARKRANLFSLYAQVVGFVVEVLYILATISIKKIGEKYFPKNSREYSNTFLVTQFGVLSTVQIFVSSDLRKKLLSLVKN
jgi:hypothetical protein